MDRRKRRRGPPIHESIKKSLGYEPDATDDDVYKDWKERTSRVCKPCWELKYCPYGPLVEQLPLLPPLRSEAEEHHEYFRRCLETGTVGEISELTDELRKQYQSWLQDEDLLRRQALNELARQTRFDEIGKLESEEERVAAWLGDEIPPPHLYRVSYELCPDRKLLEADFEPEVWNQILKIAEVNRSKLTRALETGVIDDRAPIEPVRRAWFEQQVAEFSPGDHPDHIPDIFRDASCTVFGHICPVFFASEALTETQEQRRIGRRHLGFASMMRIVRRDDYRCQHCQKQLQDTEVEFDHVIPIAKGGSSEEHNVRLTCFDCNRDKSDKYLP